MDDNEVALKQQQRELKQKLAVYEQKEQAQQQQVQKQQEKQVANAGEKRDTGGM